MAGHTEWAEEFDFKVVGRSFRNMMRSIKRGLHRGRVGAEELKQVGKVLEEAAEQIEKILRRR